MKEKSVLIMSHDEDDSAKLLIQRLREIGQICYLVDLGLYPDGLSGTIDYSLSKTNLLFEGKDFSFSPDSVKSIWWRRPKGKARGSQSDPVEKYIEIESEIFTNSFFGFFKGIRWVSDPQYTRIANHKPLQLELARKIGFRIPKTLISNNPKIVSAFLLENWSTPLIMKPVGTSFVRISSDISDVSNQNLAIYTRIIDKDQVLANINMVANCPVIFQEAAEQEFDIRVTVIGETVFAIKIGHSEDLGAGSRNVDWRHQKLKRTYEKFVLPTEIEIMCIKLTQLLGLNFGAIDLCFSDKKGYVFFEINPQGQWVPSETVAGYPVSLTLARFLAEC